MYLLLAEWPHFYCHDSGKLPVIVLQPSIKIMVKWPMEINQILFWDLKRLGRHWICVTWCFWSLVLSLGAVFVPIPQEPWLFSFSWICKLLYIISLSCFYLFSVSYSELLYIVGKEGNLLKVTKINKIFPYVIYKAGK